MFKLLFSFQGRIGRGQYWAGCSLAGGATLISGLLTSGEFIGGLGPKTYSGDMLAGALASLCLSLLSLWWTFAVQVKRLHDRGRSGFWCLLPFLPLVMIVSSLISAIAANASFVVALGGVVQWFAVWCAISLWFFVELGCLPAKSGPNKYDGPNGTPTSSAPAPTGALPITSLLGIAKANATAPAANALINAEQAMARAIAERGRPATPRRALPPAPAISPAPRAGFGRKPAT